MLLIQLSAIYILHDLISFPTGSVTSVSTNSTWYFSLSYMFFSDQFTGKKNSLMLLPIIYQYLN